MLLKKAISRHNNYLLFYMTTITKSRFKSAENLFVTQDDSSYLNCILKFNHE